jgi:hypothetical protein
MSENKRNKTGRGLSLCDPGRNIIFRLTFCIAALKLDKLLGYDPASNVKAR